MRNKIIDALFISFCWAIAFVLGTIMQLAGLDDESLWVSLD